MWSSPVSSDDDVVASAGIDIVVASTTVDGLAAIRAEKIIVPGGPDDRRRLDNAEIRRLHERMPSRH